MQHPLHSPALPPRAQRPPPPPSPWEGPSRSPGRSAVPQPHSQHSAGVCVALSGTQAEATTGGWLLGFGGRGLVCWLLRGHEGPGGRGRGCLVVQGRGGAALGQVLVGRREGPNSVPALHCPFRPMGCGDASCSPSLLPRAGLGPQGRSVSRSPRGSLARPPSGPFSPWCRSANAAFTDDLLPAGVLEGGSW